MATIKDGDNVKSAQDILGDGQIQVDIFYGKAQGGMKKIVNKEIIITRFEERTSTYANGPGKFYTISAKAMIAKKQKTIGFNSGSTVLMRELDQLREHLPVKVKIRKVEMSNGFKYFTMTDRKAAN